MNCYMRHKALEGNMDAYVCCQGYYDRCCFKAGGIGDQGNPCCLALEGCCCISCSLSATRMYVMDKYDLQSDPCDRRIIRFNNCIQCLACICHIAAIIDPETRKVVPRGVPGELYVGGSALMHGYYGKPEETAKRLVEGFMPEMHNLWSGKWYQSGDCGRFVGEPPVLEIRGRIDSTVKIRGFKVGIPVVESSILEVEGVGTCCCVPVYESPAVVEIGRAHV